MYKLFDLIEQLLHQSHSIASVLNMEHCTTKEKAGHLLHYLIQPPMPWTRWALLTEFLRSEDQFLWTPMGAMGTISSSPILQLFIPLLLLRNKRFLTVIMNPTVKLKSKFIFQHFTLNRKISMFKWNGFVILIFLRFFFFFV